VQTADYCREIESYLCQKNGGHLIRVVGPSFELVSKWAADGVPLKVAFRGIDRYCERYYKKGRRRRPARIDFCEADVLDVFDEWRRALGLTSSAAAAGGSGPGDDPGDPGDPENNASQTTRRGPSLPAHIERILLRLTQARVAGTLGPGLDALLDRLSAELDAARAWARGLRGDAREALVARLADADRELLQAARGALTGAERQQLEKDGHAELAAFRATMPPAAYARAHDAAMDRLVRERARLPTLAFE
jgi:hypothetical protein